MYLVLVYSWYRPGIYCRLADYIFPTTFYQNQANSLKTALVDAFIRSQILQTYCILRSPNISQRWTKRWNIRGPKFIDPKQLQNWYGHLTLNLQDKTWHFETPPCSLDFLYEIWGSGGLSTWACRVLHLKCVGCSRKRTSSLGRVNQIINLVARLLRGATFVSMAKIVVFSCIVTFSWVVRPLSSLGCILYVTLSLPLSRTGGRYHHGRAVPSLGQDSALQCHQGVVFFFQGFSQGFNSVSKLHSIFPVPKRVLEAETPRNNHQTQFSWVLRLITVDMYRLCFMSYGPIDY